MIPRQLASAIIVLVSLVWAANFIAQFIVDNYRPDVTLNGVFMAIVGGALALSRKDKGGGDGGES
jgi:hypothetical protein